MINITYLIPLDSLGGGVEVAAKGVKNISNLKSNFNVEYIFKNKTDLFKFSLILTAIKSIYLIKPDILIVSLWRSQFIGICIKILLPRTKVVFFVHSAGDAHFLDYFISRFTLFFATEVWGDSVTSLRDRFKISNKAKKGRVISFSARQIERIEFKKVVPKFIFWGRVGKEKGVERSILIFSKILIFFPNATFTIIGSDGGRLNGVKNLCISLNIFESVIFYDEMEFSEITKYADKACFYLQTSVYEGAAMSVMESMKLGLVPIVTPVGEISRYCNYKNAIIVDSNFEAVRSIIMALESQDIYNSLSNNAALKFEFQTSYSDSIVSSCEAMIKKWY